MFLVLGVQPVVVAWHYIEEESGLRSHWCRTEKVISYCYHAYGRATTQTVTNQSDADSKRHQCSRIKQIPSQIELPSTVGWFCFSLPAESVLDGDIQRVRDGPTACGIWLISTFQVQ